MTGMEGESTSYIGFRLSVCGSDEQKRESAKAQIRHRPAQALTTAAASP
jgi:hypothetical protein